MSSTPPTSALARACIEYGIDVEDLATALGCSGETVRTWTRNGGAPIPERWALGIAGVIGKAEARAVFEAHGVAPGSGRPRTRRGAKKVLEEAAHIAEEMGDARLARAIRKRAASVNVSPVAT